MRIIRAFLAALLGLMYINSAQAIPITVLGEVQVAGAHAGDELNLDVGTAGGFTFAESDKGFARGAAATERYDNTVLTAAETRGRYGAGVRAFSLHTLFFETTAATTLDLFAWDVGSANTIFSVFGRDGSIYQGSGAHQLALNANELFSFASLSTAWRNGSALGIAKFSPTVVNVPEPSTLGLLGMGLLITAISTRRRGRIRY